MRIRLPRQWDREDRERRSHDDYLRRCHDEGYIPVRLTLNLAQHLDDWSEPVQLRLIRLPNGERNLEARRLEHPPPPQHTPSPS